MMCLVGIEAQAQQIPALPTLNSGQQIIFDDFVYPVHLSSSDFVSPSSPRTGTLIGSNGWFEPSGSSLASQNRHGWFLGVIDNRSQKMAGFGGNTYTSITSHPNAGIVELKLAKGTHPDGLNLADFADTIDMLSAFQHRTGTWVTRVRLPDFDGTFDFAPLPSQPQSRPNLASGKGNVDDMQFHSAFWARGWADGLDTRPGAYGLNDQSDWNLEINNWYGHRPRCVQGSSLSPSQVDWSGTGDGIWSDAFQSALCGWGRLTANISGSHYMAAGIPLARPSAHTQHNPIHATFRSHYGPGTCYGVNEDQSTGSRALTHGECLEYITAKRSADVATPLTNNATDGTGDGFVYLVTRVTPTGTSFEFVVQEEHAYWAQGSKVGPLVGLTDADHVWANTEPTTTFVKPSHVSARYMLAMQPGSGAPDGERDFGDTGLEEAKSMLIDWFFYTPSTTVGVYSIIADVSTIRTHLWGQYNNSYGQTKPLTDQIWRVNSSSRTNSYDHSGYYRQETSDGVDPITGKTYEDCRSIGVTATRPWHFSIEKYPNGSGNGDFYLYAVPIENSEFGLRWATYSVAWSLRHYSSDGKRIGGSSHTNHGLAHHFKPPENASRTSVSAVVTRVNSDRQACREFPSDESSRTVTTSDIQWRLVVSPMHGDALMEDAGLSIDPPSPNPTSGRSAIRFSIPSAGTVRVTLHDIVGREISVLVEENLQVGSHEAMLQMDGLPVGSYFVRLSMGAISRTHRIIIVR